jgi:hypothetical protein
MSGCCEYRNRRCASETNGNAHPFRERFLPRLVPFFEVRFIRALTPDLYALSRPDFFDVRFIAIPAAS